MLKNYLYPLALAALLLAGCGRTERATETAAPALARRSAARPVPTPTTTPAAESMTLLLRPDAPATRPPGVAPLRAARHWAARPAPARQPLAPAQPAPDSAATAALRDYLRGQLPTAQTFALRPGRDTLLLGRQGTQVLVPADAFDLPDSTATVQVQLQEFYTPADMVLAGLSTAAGPDLLETGGMVRLTATAGGQPLRLRPGRRLGLRLPAPTAQPDMQLFEGVAHGTARPLDWQLPGSVAATRRPTSPARPRLRTEWPENKLLPQALRQQLRAAMPQRRTRHNPIAALAARLRSGNGWQVELRFALDSAGGLGSVRALPGSHARYAPVAVAALRQVGRWQPGRLPAFAGAVPVGEPMPAVGSLRASFTPKYGLLVQPVSWSLPRTRLPRARRLRHLNDSLLAQPAFRQRYWQAQDSLAYLRMLATQARLLAEQARLRAQFTDTARTAITQDGVYNELQTQGLGWINCDRFAGQGKILFTYKVAPRQPDAIVSLVFRDMRSVLQGRPQPNELVAFANAPLGQAATVVALRRQDGVTYLARRDVRVGLATLTKLDFHPVTMAELRTELATLR